MDSDVLNEMADMAGDPAVADKLKVLVATTADLNEKFLWRHGTQYANWVAKNPNWPGKAHEMPEDVMRVCITDGAEHIKLDMYWKLSRTIETMTRHGLLPVGHLAIHKLAALRYRSQESNGLYHFERITNYLGPNFVEEEWKHTTEKSRAWFLAIPNIPEKYKYLALRYYLRRKMTYEIKTTLSWDKLKKIPGRYFAGMRNLLYNNKLEGTPWTPLQLKQHVFSGLLKVPETGAMSRETLKRDLGNLIEYYEKNYKEVK